jgi:hypothetical protein
VFVVVAAATLAWRDAANRSQQKEVALQQLVRDQKKRAEGSANNPAANEHADTSNLQFKDVSGRDFARPSCKRLENRKAIVITNGCNYELRAFGEVNMAVVFVYEAPGYEAVYNRLKNNDPNDQNSLYYFNSYIKSQAARYGVSDPAQLNMTFYGPYQVVRPANNLYYRDNRESLLDIFQDTSESNKVPEGDYDLVHYVFLDQTYGGVAFPTMHRAFTENDFVVQTFVHETLHLFNASDKYNNNDCSTIGTNDPFGRYNGTLPGTDVMCGQYDLNISKINDITAREIGWAN